MYDLVIAIVGAAIYLLAASRKGSSSESAKTTAMVAAVAELGRLAFLAGLIGYCLSAKGVGL